MLHASNEAAGKNMPHCFAGLICLLLASCVQSQRQLDAGQGDLESPGVAGNRSGGASRQRSVHLLWSRQEHSYTSWLHNKSFPVPIWFNKGTREFEIVDNAKKNRLKQLKSLVRAHTPVDPIYNVTIKSERKYPQFEQKITALDLTFENNFITKCLDPEQGVTWIKNERLPAFLMSDCYFEYRLAKLLSQLECNTGPDMPQIDPAYRPWVIETEENPMPNIVVKVETIMEELYISHEEQGDVVSVYREASVTQTEALFTGAGEEVPSAIIQTEGSAMISIGSSTTSATPSMMPVESNITYISPSDDANFSVEPRMLLESGSRQSPRKNIDNEQGSCSSGLSKPTVVEGNIFDFISECPLRTPRTVFLEVKSESETEDYEEEKEEDKVEVSTDDKTTTQSTATDLPSMADETKPQLCINTKINTHTPKSNVSQTSQLNVERPSAVSDNIKGFSDCMGEESTKSDSSNEEDDIRGFCYVTPCHSYNFKSRKGIEKFKMFLQGTAGEKYWWLWMDIERLKVIKDYKKKQSYLNKIRNRYLFGGGEYYMNAETRAKLGLSFISQWTAENLCQIQSDIVAPLLLYWGPRYYINQKFPIRQAGIVLKDWKDRQLRPKSDVVSIAITLPNPVKIDCTPKEKRSAQTCKPHQSQRKVPRNRQPLKTCCTAIMFNAPLSTYEIKEQLTSTGSIWSHGSKSMEAFEDLALRKAKDLRNLETLMQITKYHEVLCDYKVDNLLQALHHESRTGYIFTRFCEQTGNVLWSNAVNLWFDLVEYQHLFYAEVFQPFKLRRQAQFIFATYTVEGAPANVEIDSENKNMIYRKLEPPFEELFDQLEEHILILLLTPWIQMLEKDLSRYRKVELISRTQHLDSIYYKKLQELRRKFSPSKDIPDPVRSVQIPEDPKSSRYWQMVPEEFRSYTFSELLRNRLELEHFQTFLKENLAGMDLMCWLDIDQYRKIPSNEMKDDKSKEIITKYLNRKYFFGPSSPATKMQQDEVAMLAGGQDKLLHNQLSSEIVIEVQNYAKARLESKWLPMFLASPEFAERQHKRVQLQDVVEDQMLYKSRKRRDVMKHLDNKWASSSKEIIAFRKALLNPVTALQFQKYVSVKGELMENNVTFWLEVQKYKNLCHSHVSEEIIQNKITVIINCFINSNIPPNVQIDIPPEYASKIINQRQEMGPYIFREAQMAVFDILFKLWLEFSAFRHGITVEHTLPSSERIRMMNQEVHKRNGTEEGSTETSKLIQTTTKQLSTDSLIDLAKVRNDTSNRTSHKKKAVDLNVKNQQQYFDTVSKSTGSQISLKGGSDKPTDDEHEMKTKKAGSTQKAPMQRQKLSWSFSKYIEALSREEELILREREADRIESVPISIAFSEPPSSDTTPSDLKE
uniref:regulator of G-protein signaling 22-like n=1 Tax=Pristiophorus japonicus TaxID=55135 RepID=UPI00398ED8B3